MRAGAEPLGSGHPARRRHHHGDQRLLLGVCGTDPLADVRGGGPHPAVAADVCGRPRSLRADGGGDAAGSDRGGDRPRRLRDRRSGLRHLRRSDPRLRGGHPAAIDRPLLHSLLALGRGPSCAGGAGVRTPHDDRDPAPSRPAGRPPAAAARRTAGLRLVCCFSRDESRRLVFAQELGCAAAPSFDAAIDRDDIEGVLLGTPNYVHGEQAMACAPRRKHVFVEKPIADALSDGQAMAAACQAAGVALMGGHGLRRLGAARRVRQLLEEGTLGTVVLAEANFSLPGTLTPDTWRAYRRTCPGGPLMQLGVHHADTLQYWLGPGTRGYGSFAPRGPPGARGVLTSSYVSPQTYSLRLYGTAAVLEYRTDMSVWPAAEKMDGATTLSLLLRP